MDDKRETKRSTKPIEEIFRSDDRVIGLRFDKEDILEFTLHNVNFEGCDFHDCVFDQSRVTGGRFVNCRFTNCSFKETIFVDCKFSEGTDSSACTWTLCNLSESTFENCHLGVNTLSKCIAYMAEFKTCSAMGLLFDADVHRRVSNRLITGGVTFSNSRLQYAAFRARDLSESKFEQCDLRDASFAKSDLTGCSFAGSALNNIDLSLATLDRAILSYATFDEFNLEELRSFSGMIISQDQQLPLLRSLGISVVG
jgi:fluoroquinolone resistance protein